MPDINSILQQLQQNGQYTYPTGGNDLGHWLSEGVKGCLLYLWDGAMPWVKWICTVAAVMGLISALYGFQKGKSVAGGSIGIFVFLKMLDYLFKG